MKILKTKIYKYDIIIQSECKYMTMTSCRSDHPAMVIAEKEGALQNEKTAYSSIEEYIMMFSPDTRAILQHLRDVIHDTAPQATEKISYQMPTFYLNGNLVHFAAYKNHIGFYPSPSGILAFSDELAEYRTSKGAIQFPIKKPLPYDLIRRIVRFRVEENRSAKENPGGLR